MATDTAVILFWLSLFLLGYVYIGYPLIAWLRGRYLAKPCARAAIDPFVSIIVVAHNEGCLIRRRIENLLASDYPRQRFEIIIGSDGSTDETVTMADCHWRDGVRVFAFDTRRGKAAVLNDLVPEAYGEIILFADARQRFEPDAIRALVANFADPGVGAVSGELVLHRRANDSATGHASEGAGFYWKYEKFIRANESWAGSTVGATGAIYAIRKSLFEEIPEDTLLDDVLIPIRIVRRGYRVLFEAGARAHDRVSSTPEQEFVRKTRTIAGTFQLLAREAWILNPLRSRVWFQALSHKALRLAIPVLHTSMFVANAALTQHLWFYRWTMAVQLIFYAAALAGHALAGSQKKHVLLTVPYMMTLLGWATIVGLTRFVTRRQRVTWERIPTTP
jgi:cellulose synthase/poly-beta-1,6-N-acetylglucosamine synthase-like glycosyltransferase